MGLQGAVELPARDEIHTAPLPDEEPEDRCVRIGLDGKADDVGNLRKGRVKDAKMVQKRPVAVEIKGGARLPGDPLNRNLLAEEGLILIVKIIHRSLFFCFFALRHSQRFSRNRWAGADGSPQCPWESHADTRYE